MKKQITNRELIEQLSKFDLDKPVRFTAQQYNKNFPLYLDLGCVRGSLDNSIVDNINSCFVTINLNIPSTEDTYSVVSTRKKK